MIDNGTNTEDTYHTIETEQRAEFKVKSSVFIGTATPINSKEQAIERLEMIRKEFYDATHNCYAYRLGEKGLDFRAADDGEPNGTAGKPILFSIQKYGVSDILLVVTRYFGGTKLGTGGLARAYSASADAVLSVCTKKPVYKTSLVRVFCTYEDVKTILKLLEKHAVSFEGDYRDAIEFTAHVFSSKVEQFSNELTTLTNGRSGIVTKEL